MGRIRLTDVQRTCLPTLYGKALDARTSDPILGDTFADEAVRKMDFDFASLKLPKGASVSLPVRAKHLDGWTRDFLAAQPDSTVLQLGCGLDGRVFRIDPSPRVRWYDVDLAEVIELRAQLYPGREGYRTISTSVTDPAWLADVPADRPVLVVAEGLVMHIPTPEMAALFGRIVQRFPGGQFGFDVYGAPTARFITWASRLGPTKASLHSGLPKALATGVPRLRLLEKQPYLTLPELVSRLGASAIARAYFTAVAAGFMRDSILHLRYGFGAPGGM